MQIVGKIDENIYKCITDDIKTDDVIITSKQMRHVLERHPDSYDKAVGILREVISTRICTSEGDPGYKNSIISSWKISDKRLENYLRNKSVRYKKE